MVVYLLIPTSNHNQENAFKSEFMLFISWFLHQTTTGRGEQRKGIRCLSLDSYIKPQPVDWKEVPRGVVYLLIPTSNHNSACRSSSALRLFISWFLHQTTTTPCPWWVRRALFISWFLHQTTTAHLLTFCRDQLFISWFLHQTTTPSWWQSPWRRCLSLDSYIKPQLIGHADKMTDRCLSLDSYIKPQRKRLLSITTVVVYLLIPTSNHNVSEGAIG